MAFLFAAADHHGGNVRYVAGYNTHHNQWSGTDGHLTDGHPIAGITSHHRNAALGKIQDLIDIMSDPDVQAPRYFIDIEPEDSHHHREAADAVNLLLESLNHSTVYLYAQGHGRSAEDFIARIEVPDHITLVFAIPTYGGTTVAGAEQAVEAVHHRPHGRFVMIMENGEWGHHFRHHHDQDRFLTDHRCLGRGNYIP